MSVVGMLPSAAAAQRTVAADSLVDSAGVNIHLHYSQTLYWDDFPLVKSRLIELGVRHVRDGIIDTTWQPYYERHNALGEAGIRGTFIMGVSDSVELMTQYPARMSRTFEAFEAPNEHDKSGDPNWVVTLRESLVRLGQLKNDPRTAAFPTYGPSLASTEAHASLGDVSASFDIANLHNYFAGRHPGTPGWGTSGYGSIAWNLDQVRPYAGGKPIAATETGYQDSPSVADAIPQEVAGRYMPRLLLEQFRAGVTRTFIYELADFPNSGGYGLLNHDGSPKPAFTAVKSLLNLLADPGATFTRRDLDYTVEGGTADVHHMVFQKRDGSYFLAIWLALPSYDVAARQHLTVPTQTVTVTLPHAMRHIRTHQWTLDGSVSTTSATTTAQSVPVTVSDSLTLIELVEPPPPPATGEGVPGAPSALTATVHYRSVLFGWQAPTDGGTPTGYTIEAASSLDFAGAITLNGGPLTQLFVPDVVPGVYFARVRARNAQGSGPPSAVTEVTIGTPSSLQIVVLQTLVNPMVLLWSPSWGADHYILSAGTSPGTSDLAVVDMGKATYLVSSAPVGTRLYVRVAAVNRYGATRSNEISFVLGDMQPPGRPSLADAQTNGTRVALSWTPGPGGTPQSYVLMVGSSSGATDVGALPVGATTSIAAESPIVGRLFARVVAQNKAGVAASNEIAFSIGGNVETPTLRPPVVSGSTVHLSWTVGGLATSYLVLARATPTGPLVASIPVGALELTVPGAPPGTYIVSVVARRGNLSSAESNQVAVTVH